VLDALALTAVTEDPGSVRHLAGRHDGGGPGLGVSGSGDVRAGLVAGLLARGADPAQAALWAGHLHGRAGERLAARMGPLGYLARELAPQVPALLVEIEH
jgi:NAD(P)H-hydrate repair Nnr-like enzyme with NAD(P)H-hydrate dehydratase domain